ncbi:MAG: hypothetical protein LBJ72_12845 [Dysgonamonadaceae bacterium]|jgi:hypothetical protein|nr:hypothetical protein [Dysgonamonadaceae bacterium]
MISDKLTKTQFVVNVLKRDIENIYTAQRLIAQKNIYISGRDLKKTKRRGVKIGERSGSLLRSLENPDYFIQANNGHFVISAGIVRNMRFLDMKHLGNRKIYNRQVWGILYNNSLPEIRSGYGQELFDTVGEALKKAFSTDKPEQ